MATCGDDLRQLLAAAAVQARAASRAAEAVGDDRGVLALLDVEQSVHRALVVLDELAPV